MSIRQRGQSRQRSTNIRAPRLLGNNKQQTTKLPTTRQNPPQNKRKSAIVVPDNVLFEGEVGETVRRKLLHECDVHTLLRLPTGVFYAQGVKANVLFFDHKPASETPWTEKLDIRLTH